MATHPQRGVSQRPAPGSSGRKKPPSAFRIWFEEAWAGWLKHVSLILAAALLFLVYQMDLFNERLLGLILSLGIALGALAMAVVPSRQYVRTEGQRRALYALAALWAVVAAYPVIYAIFPGAVLGTAQLANPGAQATISAPDGGKAIHVSGHLRGGGGDVDATYRITAQWQGGQKTVAGELTRAVGRVRVGRRGSGISVTEHNEQKHYLGRTSGPVVVKLEDKDEAIDRELKIELRPAPVRPLLLVLVASAVFVAALALDRIIDPKGRTNLGTAAAISLTFALYFGFRAATAHHVVSPAIGAFLIAIIAGGLGGWVISFAVKKLTPDKKRRPAPR